MAKVKGLLKGLRYISQIFDEQKDQEMQIGLPTDVKHVAHIGWDGNGLAVDNPSWMEGFKTPEEGPQSATLSVGETKQIPDDSKRTDHSDVPKSTRRLSGRKKSSSSSSSGTNSPRNEKSRHSSRRHRLKDSESSSLNRVESARTGSDESLLGRDLEEIPKKSRRKKSSKSKSHSSTSSSGSGFLTCGSEPEFSINSSKSIKEVKESSQAC